MTKATTAFATGTAMAGETCSERLDGTMRREEQEAKQVLALHHADDEERYYSAVPTIEDNGIGCELDSPSAARSRTTKTKKCSDIAHVAGKAILDGEEQPQAAALRPPQSAQNSSGVSSRRNLETEDVTAGGQNKGAPRSRNNLAAQVDAVADRLSRLLTMPIQRHSRTANKAGAGAGASCRWEEPPTTNNIAKTATQWPMEYLALLCQFVCIRF